METNMASNPTNPKHSLHLPGKWSCALRRSTTSLANASSCTQAGGRCGTSAQAVGRPESLLLAFHQNHNYVRAPAARVLAMPSITLQHTLYTSLPSCPLCIEGRPYT